MKIQLKVPTDAPRPDIVFGEGTVSIDAGACECELEGVYNGIGIQTDDGHFGIAQRDGGIEVLRDSNLVFPHQGSQPEFADARKIMADHIFAEDEGLLQSYEANVAMLLYDFFDKANFKDPGTRDEAARMVLRLIFKGERRTG